MSDVMLFGVLRMPYELAMSDEMSRFQFYQRAQQAADELTAFKEREPVRLTGEDFEKIARAAFPGGTPIIGTKLCLTIQEAVLKANGLVP